MSNYNKGALASHWKGGWKNKLPHCAICNKKLSTKDAIHCPKHAIRVVVKSGEDNHMWKGNDVKYVALHQWVSKNYGKPKFCENCGSETKTKYEWANLTKEYQRDLTKYTRLCSSCHIKHDRYKYKLELPYKVNWGDTCRT